MILVFPISSFCCEYIFNDKNMIMIKNLFMKWVLDFRTTSLGYKMVATWLAEYFLQGRKINGRTMFRLAESSNLFVARVSSWQFNKYYFPRPYNLHHPVNILLGNMKIQNMYIQIMRELYILMNRSELHLMELIVQRKKIC